MDPRLTQVNEAVVKRAAARCRERGVIIPTIAQMKNPSLIPADVRARLAGVGLWDLDPVNLFRITWKNDPRTGGFNDGNWVEFPRELTGVDARIIGLVGKCFPTGAHKVGAAFGCLVPRLVTGQFDPVTQKAVWPSTGNYCRGGAFDSKLLGCESVAILPEEMSAERFTWLKGIASEVIATPGCESNVKEIYDKCWEIRRTRPECVIFNQFEEFGNPVWHYHVTGGRFRRSSSAWADPARGWRPGSRRPARPARSAPATSSRPCHPTRWSSPSRRCSVRRCTPAASAATASRASATSTCPGCTTCATPTWSPPSTTSSA